MIKQGTNYILVSPVKDEEKYITETLNSVVNQTIKPSRWIIVDDGSSDKTPEIIESYRKQFPWIEVLKTERNTARQPGSPIVNAFNRGYDLIKDSQFDFVVKLDCDLRFAPDYFEKLLQQFAQDPKLGIGSGIYLQNHGKGWLPVKMPAYHTAGACKFIRKACFTQIGGFIAAKGWDTVDEIRAQMRGWHTKHFVDLHMYHLKNEGSGIGFVKTNAMHGEIYYLTGGSKMFFMLKVLHRIIKGRPFIIGGIMVLYGYLKTVLQRRQRLVTDEEAKFYSRLLNSRILGKITDVGL
ncbi:MAG: glycosyltransferase family 2 protein [Deltaproteobacteria bacterium HGW-Deltaproteobacteria-12]|jgi:glycosyltransferase involved in cell wall biosynthesis|nr:MAG: glycosyltransferase family 2 protein [Deltaproteobacteria bacterium HGW-Deltaproteobacteria-12]